MSKLNIPMGENLKVKNAFFISSDDMTIIYHYNTAVAVRVRKTGKLYLYRNNLTQSDIKAVRELFAELTKKGDGYTYYNIVSREIETTGLIGELQ